MPTCQAGPSTLSSPCLRDKASFRGVGRSRPRLQGFCRATSQDPAGDAGDLEVQDTLVKLLKLQVGAEQVKARAAEGSATLRQTAEEAKEELEKLRQVATDRSNLGFGSALADINQAADEVAEMLRQSRAKLEADDEEFEQWQYNMARRRSEGQFFQSLYQAESPKSHKRYASSAPAAEAAPGSSLTQNVFSFLTAVLLVSIIADLLSAKPSVGQDVLYAGIAASMALSLWFGRQKPSPPSE